MNSCYFDDYVNISPDVLAANSEKTFELVLELLGWTYDKDGSKSDSMSDFVSALGVHLDFARSVQGLVYISNTEKRVAELVASVKVTLQQDRLTA